MLMKYIETMLKRLIHGKVVLIYFTSDQPWFAREREFPPLD